MGFVFLVFLFGCFSSNAVGFKIEAMQHDIQQITGTNFDGVIGKFRDSSVSVLWFFRDDSKADKAFLPEYNKVGKEIKGMVKVCAINCNDWDVFCEKNNVASTPAVMIYPINPMPAFLYEGNKDSKAMAAKIVKYIPNNSIKLNKESADGFLTTEPTKPKVILFSNKKSPPTILKALSSETVFRRTVKFGFVTDDDEDLLARFKVKKFPTILMVRGAKAEIRETFSGDLNFGSIKDWVNLHSESGMGDKVSSSGKEDVSMEEAKPWLVQEVPELTDKSHQDICFKGDGLCVVYLKDGAATQQEIDFLVELSKKFTSQISGRGTRLKFMWMNLAIEKNFRELFQPAQLPSAVVINPHKRLRYTKLDHGEDNEIEGNSNAIAQLLDKVLGGDARFTPIKGQKLPAWVPHNKKTEL